MNSINGEKMKFLKYLSIRKVYYYKKYSQMKLLHLSKKHSETPRFHFIPSEIFPRKNCSIWTKLKSEFSDQTWCTKIFILFFHQWIAIGIDSLWQCNRVPFVRIACINEARDTPPTFTVITVTVKSFGERGRESRFDHKENREREREIQKERSRSIQRS